MYELAKTVNVDSLSPRQKVIFHYCLANAWSTKRQLSKDTREKAWAFNMLELSKEIYHLRKAISLDGFLTIDEYRRCQIYTNLGNTFDFIGRFVEAQELWSNALTILPDFSMALANKAKGLSHYSSYLIDVEHSKLFILKSYELIKISLRGELRTEEEIAHKQNISDFIRLLEERIPKSMREYFPNLNDFDLGGDINLREYRKWCLNNILFINPLNDLGGYTIASHDILLLPTMRFPDKSPPIFLSLYNIMKQEFGSARYLFFEALNSDKPHYSDEDIALIETFEGNIYSFGIEKAKIAFRILYSILDKIAFLLNEYFELGIEQTKINFRTIWYSDYKSRTIHSKLETAFNWALRGLFWLSKDIHMPWEQNEIVIEPEAKEISVIRNHIEHKFFRIIESRNLSDLLYDSEHDISYSISKNDFYSKTLKLLKLVRASLIYLPLSVNQEQKKRNEDEYPTIQINPTLIPLREKV